jgi:hypothetical protein
LQKASQQTAAKSVGGIRGIAPVDIWRRAMGNAIVQATQQTAAKTCIDTYTNFKQLALSKDGVPLIDFTF